MKSSPPPKPRPKPPHGEIPYPEWKFLFMPRPPAGLQSPLPRPEKGPEGPGGRNWPAPPGAPPIEAPGAPGRTYCNMKKESTRQT